MSGNRLSTLSSVARILMFAKAEDINPLVAAERIFGPTGRMALEQLYTKSPVSSTGTDGPLHTSAGAISSAFADSIRAASIIGRLGVTRVPFGLFPFVSTRTRGQFVAERSPIPVSAAGMEPLALDRLKVATLCVVSNELLKHSQSEGIIDRDLRGGTVEGVEAPLLDGAAAVPEQRPASVLNGVTAIDATGAATAADFTAVLNDQLAAVVTAGGNLATCAFVASPEIAYALSFVRQGDQAAFPGVGALGGTLAGFPLLTTAASPANQLALIDGREILFASDPGVELTTASETLIDQSSAPDGSTPVSIFQSEATAIKCVWRVNWKIRRPYAAYAENFAPPTTSFAGSL